MDGRKIVGLSVATLGMAVFGAHLACAVVTDADIEALKAHLAEVEKQNAVLRDRVTGLEAKDSAGWMTSERTSEIQAIVRDVLADEKKHETASSLNAGYKDGFFLKSSDDAFKLVVGGLLQVRYTYAAHHADNAEFTSKPLAQGDNENSSGFDIRRGRINFTGTAFSPNLFYRLEGDFYGSATGAFTVTDAYAGYIFNQWFRVKAGSFKTPFTKAELILDANLELERSEVNFPFDPQRSLGVSVFGDILPDKWGYEVNANEGGKSNTLRYVDTSNNVVNVTSTTPTFNLDNRMAFYGRTQYAGGEGGTVSEFYVGGEPDLRKDTSNFIWLAGAAVGYESQNSTNGAFTQNSQPIVGLGSNDSPGFLKAYALNGDLYRATLDWSAKWRGLSVNTAAYFQQVNANPIAGTAAGDLPYGTSKGSFFQHGYSAQVGYMVIPQRWELLGRAGVIMDEGDPNMGQYYTFGTVYYFYGHNLKLYADVTYTPEAAYTDTASLNILNTQEWFARVQLQLKF